MRDTITAQQHLPACLPTACELPFSARLPAPDAKMTISQIQRSAIGCRAPTKRQQLETDGRLAKPPSCAVMFKTTAPQETARTPLNLNMLSRSSDESKTSFLTRASPLPVKSSAELANCRLAKKGQCGLESCFCQRPRRDDNNAIKAQWLAAPTTTNGLTNANNKTNFSRTSSGYGSLRSRSDADCGLRILGVKSEYGIRDPGQQVLHRLHVLIVQVEGVVRLGRLSRLG